MLCTAAYGATSVSALARYTGCVREWFVVLVLLVLAGLSALVFSVRNEPGKLIVAFLDVGQGDATFITTPSGRQILIDGGPDRSVLRELAQHMPWWDRSIDVIIATHPDADHVSGLIDVLQRYDTSLILEPGVMHDTPQAESLLSLVASEDAERILARRGQYIDFGDGVRLEILFPDRDVTHLETNTASIVSRIAYGEVSVLLTGDAPEAIETYLVSLEGARLGSDILKAGHHGSRTSSSLIFVGYASPQYAVISRGCDNSYGHPHADVLATFARLEVPVLDTCMEGSIIFESDGVAFTR